MKFDRELLCFEFIKIDNKFINNLFFKIVFGNIFDLF